jgi:hypothetical protein
MGGKASRLVNAYCCYCRRPLDRADSGTRLAATVDHVVATARREAKGYDGKGMWVPCCFICNHLKGSLHVNEWWWFINHHPRYWRDFDSEYQVRLILVEERTRRAYAGTPPLTREPMIWNMVNQMGRLGT